MTRPGLSKPDAELDRALRERPGSGPEPTDQDTYYDAGTLPVEWDAPTPPWTDDLDDHEDEL